MPKGIIWLPKFDVSKEFVFRKKMKILGVVYRAGDHVDKDAIDDRKLRQLYEMRAIHVDQNLSAIMSEQEDNDTEEQQEVDETVDNKEETDKNQDANPDGDSETEKEVKASKYSVEVRGGGWYKLLKNGKPTTETSMRDEDLLVHAAEIISDENELAAIRDQLGD